MLQEQFSHNKKCHAADNSTQDSFSYVRWLTQPKWTTPFGRPDLVDDKCDDGTRNRSPSWSENRHREHNNDHHQMPQHVRNRRQCCGSLVHCKIVASATADAKSHCSEEPICPRAH